MINAVLLLAIVVLPLLLAAFIYQIITTPVPAVDAPTLIRSAAAPAPPARALPARQRQARALPARGGGRRGRTGGAARPSTGPAPGASPRGAVGKPRSWGAAALAIAGLAAGMLGGGLLVRSAPGALACSHQVLQVCSQGLVVLTGSQVSGGTIAVTGMLLVIIAGVLALR